MSGFIYRVLTILFLFFPSLYAKNKQKIPNQEEVFLPSQHSLLLRELSSSFSEKTDSSKESSKSSSKSSNDSSSDSSEEENIRIEPQYDYFNEQFIQSLIDHKSRYFLVATGWSESSLGKMNAKNGQKQKRSFPMSYLLADKIVNMGGRAMIVYQTTAPINYEYRKYLYYLSHRHELNDNIPNFIQQSFRFDQFNQLDKTDDELEATLDKKVHAFERSAFRINHLTIKNRRKFGKDNHRFLDAGQNAYRRIKTPKITNRFHRSPFESTTFVGFTAHFSGPRLEERAKALNLPYLVNPGSQAYRIKKSQSRQSFRDSGVRHPRGTYEPAFSIEALTDDIYNLLMEIDYPKLVLKLDESAGGYGNKVMRFNDFYKEMDELEAKAMISRKFRDESVFPLRFIERIEDKNGGAIVEEFIVGEDFSSPATVYLISGLHQVSMRYTYDQLLGGTDNQDFKGSLGPVKMLEEESSNIEAMSMKIGFLLSEQEVRGIVGTDFVIVTMPSGERLAFAIENNVRNTGTSYPYNAMKMLVGEQTLKQKFMKAFDDVQIPQVKIKAFRLKIQELFYRHLRHHPLTIDKETARGCLVHHDTFLIGKIGVVCIGDSLEEAQEMFDTFTEDAQNFLTNLPEQKAYEKYQNTRSKQNKDELEDDDSNTVSDSSLGRSESTISFNLNEDDGIIEEISIIDGKLERSVSFVF